jgi:hypothetical protein
MSDSLFVDTNILVYSSLKDTLSKHDQAVSFIASFMFHCSSTEWMKALLWKYLLLLCQIRNEPHPHPDPPPEGEGI